jgi:hypothetical protein
MRQPLKCIERLDYMNDSKRSATPLGYDRRGSHRCFSTDSEIMANDNPFRLFHMNPFSSYLIHPKES